MEIGRLPESELLGPEIPDALSYLWDWLMELDVAREIGANGPLPFTYQQLDAWARLTDRDPTPLEVDALMKLGLVLLYPGDLE